MSKRNIFLLLFSSFSILCFAQSAQIYEVSRNTSFKSKPDSDARTILRFSKNDQVVHLGDCRKYYCRVEFNGQRGWVKKRLIKKVKATAPYLESASPIEEVQPTLKEEFQQEAYILPPIEEESNAKESEQEIALLEDATTDLTTREYLKEENGWGYFLPWYSIIGLFLLFSLLGYLLFDRIMAFFQLDKEHQTFKEKYKGIDDVEHEIDQRRKKFRGTIYNYETEIKALDTKKYKIKSAIQNLELDHREANKQYNQLVHECNLLRNDLDIAEYGVYEPQFDFETSGIFKLKIQEIRNEQKLLIKEDKAVLSGQDWTVSGSAAKGRAMIKRQKKLMLRAFNGECDSHISSVKWNNVRRIEERILKSVGTINKMGATQSLTISTIYSKLKLIELKLTHEYNLKKHTEKEAQRRIKEQIREEEKAKRDYEKALKEAEKEEMLLQKLMKQAQAKYAKASEEEKLLYKSKMYLR